MEINSSVIIQLITEEKKTGSVENICCQGVCGLDSNLLLGLHKTCMSCGLEKHSACVQVCDTQGFISHVVTAVLNSWEGNDDLLLSSTAWEEFQVFHIYVTDLLYFLCAFMCTIRATVCCREMPLWMHSIWKDEYTREHSFKKKKRCPLEQNREVKISVTKALTKVT